MDNNSMLSPRNDVSSCNNPTGKKGEVIEEKKE